MLHRVQQRQTLQNKENKDKNPLMTLCYKPSVIMTEGEAFYLFKMI